jgi:hypothetical protein
MLGLKREQRHLLADKLPDVANLGVAGLIFAQFVGSQRFSLAVAVAGLALWIVLVVIALVLAKPEEEA